VLYLPQIIRSLGSCSGVGEQASSQGADMRRFVGRWFAGIASVSANPCFPGPERGDQLCTERIATLRTAAEERAFRLIADWRF
jgi:hypothetical protein